MLAKNFIEFFNFKDFTGNFSSLFSACNSKQQVSALSMGQSERVAFCANINLPILYLTNDYIGATKVYSQLNSIFGEKVALWPVFIDNLFYKRAQSTEANIARIKNRNIGNQIFAHIYLFVLEKIIIFVLENT